VRTNLLTDADIKPEQLEKIRLGMRKVVNDEGGTAGKARVKDIIVAGKTGTAQFWRNGKQDNHTWFVSFAPYDAPKYAICVMVQGAKAGGMVPAPIAAHIYDQLFAMDKDPTKAPQLAWLEPAKGNFNFVESIDFGREAIAATNTPDEDTGGDADPTRNSKQETRPAAPNVREEADAGGHVKNNPPPERKQSGLDKFFNFFKGGNKNKPNTKATPAPATGRR
jgi:penicillin-binding protein 2